MRNQFFTQPICFCYVVSSEERKAGKLFLRFPNTYHHVHSPEGAHQKQGHGPSPGILQMHLVKPYCSRAMLCLFKYICRLLRFQPPTILFFHEILIQDTAAKKNCVVRSYSTYFFFLLQSSKQEIVVFVQCLQQEITNLDFRECYFYYYRIQFLALGNLPHLMRTHQQFGAVHK